MVKKLYFNTSFKDEGKIKKSIADNKKFRNNVFYLIEFLTFGFQKLLGRLL